jgi:hypothetical protein
MLRAVAAVLSPCREALFGRTDAWVENGQALARVTRLGHDPVVDDSGWVKATGVSLLAARGRAARAGRDPLGFC